MPYGRNTYRFKNSIEVEEYLNGRYGARGEPRQKKRKATPEQIKKQNQRNKEKRIRRKIKANFQEGDYFMTLTCAKDKRPPTMAQAKQEFTKFIRKVRDECKKDGFTIKWMKNIEMGKKKAVHCHLLVTRVPGIEQIVRKYWTYGGVHMQLLYEQGDFKDLAPYLCKTPQTDQSLQECSYSCSKNMVTIEPEKEIIDSREITDPPRPRKGFYLDKESMVEGINPVTGYKYRHYTWIRLNRRI